MTTKTSQPNLPMSVGLALFMATGLTACDTSNKTTTGPPIVIVSPPLPPPPPPPIEDSFGTRFGTIFRSSANSEPVKPVQADISIAVDPTIEPRRLR
jgi:hypothetical protein